MHRAVRVGHCVDGDVAVREQVGLGNSSREALSEHLFRKAIRHGVGADAGQNLVLDVVLLKAVQDGVDLRLARLRRVALDVVHAGRNVAERQRVAGARRDRGAEGREQVKVVLVLLAGHGIAGDGAQLALDNIRDLAIGAVRDLDDDLRHVGLNRDQRAGERLVVLILRGLGDIVGLHLVDGELRPFQAGAGLLAPVVGRPHVGALFFVDDSGVPDDGGQGCPQTSGGCFSWHLLLLAGSVLPLPNRLDCGKGGDWVK